MRHCLSSLNTDRIDEKSSTPLDEILRQEQMVVIQEFLNSKTAPDRDIIEFYYFDRSKISSVKGLAKSLGFSRESIRKRHAKIKQQALISKKLREVA